MSKYVSLAAAAAVAFAVSAGATATTAQAATYTYGFSVIPTQLGDDLSGQLFFDVIGEPDDSQIKFKFRNETGIDSIITEIYFDDRGGLIDPPLAFHSASSGVTFEVPKENGQANLPRGGTLDPAFNATNVLTAERETGQCCDITDGIDPGEWLKLLVTLNSGIGIADILADLATGDLRIGLHVQSIGGEDVSDAYINDPNVIPLPAGLVLFLSGLAGIGVLGRYKSKRREVPTA